MKNLLRLLIIAYFDFVEIGGTSDLIRALRKCGINLYFSSGALMAQFINAKVPASGGLGLGLEPTHAAAYIELIFAFR
jgi:hypothetical protein